MRELLLRSAAITTCFGVIVAAGTYAFTQRTIYEGRAHVVDGDTIRVNDYRIRLAGIDAPELSQTCNRDGELWNCGVTAKTSLEYLIEDMRVRCFSQARDRYSRIIATCYDSAGTDLSRYMVQVGMAVAYKRYSRKYVPEEMKARAERKGIWDSFFIDPETYRHKGTR